MRSLPNELIYYILSFCNDDSLKNIKMICKDMYILTKDFEQKKLIKLNKQSPNLLYKMCIINILYPYNIDIKNTKKMELLFLELKLKFFIFNRSIDDITQIFAHFYKVVLSNK